MLTSNQKLTATLGPAAAVAATGVFTPPTSATATCVINGTSFLATFNTSAAQTVTDLKALIAADSTITALVITGGTTTLTLTARTPGAAGNAITTTSNEANGAGFAAATLTGGVSTATVGSMYLLVKAYGVGSGNGLNS